MTKSEKTEADHIAETREKVLRAALPHVVFDGWSAGTLAAGIADSGTDAGLSALAFPRGAVDLALAFHYDGDCKLADAMAAADTSDMRYSEKIAKGIRLRLELVDRHREEVRKGSALFALPMFAGDGAKAIWHTADTIWNALGDTSTDVNWYTKRVTLSAVYSSAVLFWLGDESGGEDTDAFIDRRIDNVMQFEKFKATIRGNSLVKAFMTGPGKILDKVTSPGEAPEGFPGSIRK
ncbi:MAG: COQ9 family protein [Paracoccaceae bacterium]